MRTPINAMLDAVAWTLVDVHQHERVDGLPYATHVGVLEIGEYKFRCYRLNTGEAILNAEDVHAFFGGLLE